LGGPGQKPVAPPRLAPRFDFPEKAIKSLPIMRAHRVGFGREMARASFGFNKPRCGQSGQVQFLAVDHMKKNNVQWRPSEQVYPFPNNHRDIQKDAKNNQHTAPLPARKNLFETGAEIRLALSASPSQRIEDAIQLCPRG